jgi:hypothetical protein
MTSSDVTCPRCKASPGEPCVRVSVDPARRMDMTIAHAARQRLAAKGGRPYRGTRKGRS